MIFSRSSFSQRFTNLFKAEVSRELFYVSAFFLAVLNICLFYPGLFSYDSVIQLNQAISSDYDSWHPAIMAIVMHCLLPFLGNGGVFIIHQILYWLCLAFLIDTVFKKNIPWLLICGFFPPTYMLSITVWKDTGMMVALMWGITLFLRYVQTQSKKPLFVSLIFFTYALGVRINSIFIIAPTLFVFFYFKYLFTKKTLIKSIFVTIFLIVFCTGINWGINRLHNVKQVSSLPSLMLWDIAGINKVVGLKEAPPSFITYRPGEKTNWIEAYQPTVCDLCWSSDVSCVIAPEDNLKLIEYWLQKLISNPLTYLDNRYKTAKTLFGIDLLYYPAHSYLQNDQLGEEFGISILGKKVQDFYFSVIDIMSKLFLYQPITYLILSLFSLGCVLFGKRKFIELNHVEILATAFSVGALTNAFSLFFIAVACDYRYMIWTVIGGLLSFILILLRSKLEN